ncbi:MAG: phosphatase PAP2 family protein [Bacteroidales bacterium]|nr:phosphatase PAP2 family protein [Bacteroidales bacterium]
MKRSLFLILSLAMVLIAHSQEPQPLLTPQQMPNPVRFLPPPPDKASDAFAYDQSQYRWGKEQRLDSARLSIAVRDADWSIDCICREFSEPFGMTISKEATPAIFRLLYVALISADMVGKLPKDFYKRTRPYVYYGEPTIYPQDEEELRNNGSYPSGHTIEGWSAALILTELNPDRADTILARGYMYGESRVIAGYHWQSDVDAGRLAASAAIARLHADRRFMRLLRKAHREFRCLSRKQR